MARRSAERPTSRVVASPRLTKRRRAVRFARLRKHRRKLIAAAVVVTLGTGGWFAVHSSLFALGGVEVRGNALLDRGSVLAASRLRVGMNLLSVDAGTVERALERLAVVADARVERIYPSRVRITLRERRPVVVVETPSGAWYAGADGRLIVPVARSGSRLPRVEIDAPVDSPELTDALRLWVAVPAAMRPRVSAVEAAEPGALALIIDGVRVIFGTPESVSDKIEAAKAVMARATAEGRRLRHIDVRAPRRPAARTA